MGLGLGIAGFALVLAAPAQTPFNRTLLKPDAGAADGSRGPWSAAFATARQAVVHVYVEVEGRNRFKIERPGTGIVITTTGLVVTHAALVREVIGATDKQLFVQFVEGSDAVRPARLVQQDATTGLALLQIESADGGEWPALSLAMDVRPGQKAAVLAFPDGEDLVAFAGVVMGASGPVSIGDGEATRTLAREQILLTDAAIQRRCHGAALLDQQGALIGICSAERVVAELAEPTLADLKQPTFGFVIPAASVEKAFGAAVRGARRARPGRQEAFADAVARSGMSVVAVQSDNVQRTGLGVADPFASRRRPGIGSGVVVDSTGLVLTNRHLVLNAQQVTITLLDGTHHKAKVEKTDAATNTALLRVALPAGASMTAMPWGDPDLVPIGAEVMTIGNPEGHTLSLGLGVLSARRPGRLQTDATVGNQNGGGALVDRAGRLLGLVDAGVRDAIDIAYAQRGDRAKLDTSLNLVPDIQTLRRIHGQEIGSSAAPSKPSDPPHDSAADIVEIVAKAAPSMLNIYVEFTSAEADLESNPFATARPRTMVEGLGSGVIIDSSGLALSNWHVVASATDSSGAMRKDRVVRAALADGRSFQLEVLSISREEDLALLQLVLEPGTTVQPVPLGSSAELQVGDRTIAIGNPHGRANTVTAGVLTAKNQAIRVRGRWAKLNHLLETDAAINAGNSGGALLDGKGRLIGINSAGGSVHAVTGYAIAVDHVRTILHSVLLTSHKLRSVYTGIEVSQDGDLVRVFAVDPTGPARELDIRRGDRVLALDGEPVSWSGGFMLALLRKSPDEALPLRLERDGQTLDRQVVPISAAAHAVTRQAGLLTDELTLADEPELIQEAAIALLRRFTRDPNATPTLLPGRLVRVAHVLPGQDPAEGAIRAGDLLLGLLVPDAGDGGEAAQLRRFERIEDLQRCFQEQGSYEGRTVNAWIYRDGIVHLQPMTVRRLLP